MMHTLAVSLAMAMTLFSLAGLANAQSLGTFSWQLQPFCNNLTVQVTQQGNLFTIQGSDDQCGAAQRAPLVGTGTYNPDGTFGIGLHIITVPGGRPVDIDARITIAGGLSGPWTDSAGNSGTFAFNAHTAGSPRPLPPAATTRLVSSGLTTAVVRLAADANVVVRTVTLNIPSAGQVMANASGLFGFTTGNGFTQLGWCSITTGTGAETAHYMYARIEGSNGTSNIPFAGARVYSVTPGPFTVRLVCQGSSSLVSPGFDAVTLQTAQLSALFVPN